MGDGVTDGVAAVASMGYNSNIDSETARIGAESARLQSPSAVVTGRKN